MSGPTVSIILRSFNEAWALKDTLAALRAQEYSQWELIVIDSGSTDGSQDLIHNAQPRHFVQLRPSDYVPGRVLNMGMNLAGSPFGIFLNADATPQGVHWLAPLVDALQAPNCAAVFGRQIPRPDCRAVYACDYDRCFGPRRQSTKWEHFFSMVSSGICKDLWAKRGFLEDLQYAEDDEYTRWARTQGYDVTYVEDSVVMHSHNYTAHEAYKRSYGDAKALAASWQRSPAYFNFARTCLLGCVSDLRHDFRFCWRERRLVELRHAARIRWQQRRGKLDGFRAGWRFYREKLHENTGSNQSLSPALSRGV